MDQLVVFIPLSRSRLDGRLEKPLAIVERAACHRKADKNIFFSLYCTGNNQRSI